jgi:hypothetical protein
VSNHSMTGAMRAVRDNYSTGAESKRDINIGGAPRVLEGSRT